METTNVFEKMAQNLQNIFSQVKPFDPSLLNDPIATQTQWNRLVSGGANFRTFKLVQVNTNRIKFRTTFGALLFALVFLIPGLGMVALIIWESYLTAFTTELMVAAGLGLIFAGIGGYLLYKQILPIVFDKRTGLFWKKHKPNETAIRDSETKDCVRLEFIHALQIVAEYISGKNSNYYSFELNLVLKDGKRINVIDHSSKQKIDLEAKILSEFLNVPIWDATTYSYSS